MLIDKTKDMVLVRGKGLGGTTTLATGNAVRYDKDLQAIGIDLSEEYNQLEAELPVTTAHLLCGSCSLSRRPDQRLPSGPPASDAIISSQDGYILSPYTDYLSFFFNKKWRYPMRSLVSIMIKLADEETGTCTGKTIRKELTSKDKKLWIAPQSSPVRFCSPWVQKKKTSFSVH